MSDAFWDDSGLSLCDAHSTYALVGSMALSSQPLEPAQVTDDERALWLEGQATLSHVLDRLAEWEEEFALVLVRPLAASPQVPATRPDETSSLLVVLRCSDTANSAYTLLGGEVLGHLISATPTRGEIPREGEHCFILRATELRLDDGLVSPMGDR